MIPRFRRQSQFPMEMPDAARYRGQN